MKVQILTALGLLAAPFVQPGEVLAPVNPTPVVSEAPKSILDTDTETTFYARVAVTCHIDDVLEFRKEAGPLLTEAIANAQRNRDYALVKEFQGTLTNLTNTAPELVRFLMVQTHTVQDLTKFNDRLELLYRRNRADTSRAWRWTDSLDHGACIFDAIKVVKKEMEASKK